MMLKSSLIFLSLMVSMSWNGNFRKIKLSDTVTVFVPKDFTPMTSADIKQRYLSYRKPMTMLTDPDRIVDFGVNRSFSLWNEGDLELLSKFYRTSLLNLFDKVEFIDTGIRTVNDHEFVYFEFISTEFATEDFQHNISKYTYLMYGLSEGTTYLFNFSCPLHVKAQWQSTAHQIMDAVRLK